MTGFKPPLAADEPTAGALPHEDGILMHPPMVLLVDDDESFIDLVANYLTREHGFETRTVTSPTSALAILEDEDGIDCVVSDYQMPETDGLEFLEVVAKTYPELPFVMFAGQGSEAVASKAIQHGADDYLQKDTGEARYDLLANRIRNCVTRARQTRQLNDLYGAIEDAGHAMLVTDTQGTITYANPTMEALSGYDRSDLVGETPAKLKSGAHDRAFYRELWETVLDGEVWHGEMINEREDGSRYVIDQTIAPITSGRTLEGFVAINRDITEQKERERDYRRFSQAVEHAGHAVLITDSNGLIEYVNPAFEELSGYDRDEVLGQTPALLKSGLHDRAFYQDLWGVIGNGDVWQGELVNERKDGRRYIIAQTIAPITDDEGSIEGFVAINRDVTERKAREQELERFRSAVTYAGHGVIITDSDGVIEYVNDAFEELTGYSAAEIVGETPSILKSGDHEEAFYSELWETILDGGVWHGEVTNERKDGSRYVIDQTIAPITDEDGDVDGFVAINRDITQLKSYKRELEKQNERLKQYGQTVAHDLRNPLTLLEAELATIEHDLETTDGPIDPDQLLERWEDVTSVADRMRALIDDLLTMAEQGQLVLDPEPVSLEAVAEDAWRQLGSTEATLLTEETVIDADFDRLRELLSNMFRNAIEHAGADVDVRVGPLETGPGFFIEDDGSGIPPSDRDRVLERGFTTDDEGTGYGLAIVVQIAEGHGWDVSVTDGAAGGARFEFCNVDDA
ncbi:PAS domain S-box protein [Natrarchaeobaculum sulfurireducens]|uniref:Diguanylate cyclase/phosphodiesterase (GGDEF &EAL domains) with PAS/PAC sensor(S) n=1 Tax=Natrarchaeobaculum sulfurireducens TaxID=2044521 RepID=A0A346PPM7_9EURY|nr:PAS domain S-box protein [Natrarchaeobaculum sulfurireducens]AXR78455.1 Signal transduction histidine kinase [Natrarchaeobaculum sulfurireducens]AXR81472.1 diguanylate cyclase/phosphodiesterase (GGDEF &EAL domains) with PAS/PAC sensor(s) [Natrarchaeobaculum sulfurireducens]